MTDIPALRPCPLCGNEAILSTFSNKARPIDNEPLRVISCDSYRKVGCLLKIERYGLKEAITAWNTRSQEEAMLEPLREARTALQEIGEIYAGMEGSDKTVPISASEAYLYRIIRQMHEAAVQPLARLNIALREDK